MTVTVSMAFSFASALPVPDLALESGDGVVVASGCAGPCAPAFSVGAPVGSVARVDCAAAASNAMDTAIDTGCLRCTFDTGVTSRSISSESLMPCGARSACGLFRKCHSCQHPLAIAWIASGENAQVTSVIHLRRGNSCVEFVLPVPPDRRHQRQSGEQWPRAGIGMELELAGRAGLGAYDGSL